MSSSLKKTLTPLMLWGLGVGYVISGMYFGWNLGLKEGGTLGMAIATGMIILMYGCFSFSYAELACAIPKAGGVFDYATRALGRDWGFIAGIVQVVEFVFAPPAISLAIGAHCHILIPEIPIVVFAMVAYLLFTGLNIYGVKAAASFEFFITLIALAGLFLFAGISMDNFKMENLQKNAFPNNWEGAFAAIPFAIWFFLGIEGVANVAEETINPQKVITKGFGSALITLVVVCIMTFVLSVGVNGWETIVYDRTGNTSDSPLPLALKHSVGVHSLVYKLIVGIGTLGLVASFHGLLLAAGRATFELGRIKYVPSVLGKIHPVFQTPYKALIFNMILGVVALLTERTSDIIVLSVIAALVLYIISMLSLLVFRKKEPNAVRPFHVPLYPYTPVIALVLAVISLVAVIWYNLILALMFLGLAVIAFVAFKIFVKLPLASLANKKYN